MNGRLYILKSQVSSSLSDKSVDLDIPDCLATSHYPYFNNIR